MDRSKHAYKHTKPDGFVVEVDDPIMECCSLVFDISIWWRVGWRRCIVRLHLCAVGVTLAVWLWQWFSCTDSSIVCRWGREGRIHSTSRHGFNWQRVSALIRRWRITTKHRWCAHWWRVLIHLLLRRIRRFASCRIRWVWWHGVLISQNVYTSKERLKNTLRKSQGYWMNQL